MSYILDPLVESLRDARRSKSLSQRELSTLAGVPQSHISKIESGHVDLRLSSLIELARILDLELVIVPKKSLPAIQSIVRTANKHNDEHESPTPAYRLDGEGDE
ncbi:helix-turn-helix domain-containing protein [Pseudoalteromonas fenneropenaei]|uniref:Helix-turn-helix domain-containing protein n=1 Tax=Pseudoalteromonas fenneropenaei TaxID=1737459 RepID=A0ABV7CNQ8_9GAMM